MKDNRQFEGSQRPHSSFETNCRIRDPPEHTLIKRTTKDTASKISEQNVPNASFSPVRPMSAPNHRLKSRPANAMRPASSQAISRALQLSAGRPTSKQNHNTSPWKSCKRPVTPMRYRSSVVEISAKLVGWSDSSSVVQYKHFQSLMRESRKNAPSETASKRMQELLYHQVQATTKNRHASNNVTHRQAATAIAPQAQSQNNPVTHVEGTMTTINESSPDYDQTYYDQIDRTERINKPGSTSHSNTMYAQGHDLSQENNTMMSTHHTTRPFTSISRHRSISPSRQENKTNALLHQRPTSSTTRYRSSTPLEMHTSVNKSFQKRSVSSMAQYTSVPQNQSATPKQRNMAFSQSYSIQDTSPNLSFNKPQSPTEPATVKLLSLQEQSSLRSTSNVPSIRHTTHSSRTAGAESSRSVSFEDRVVQRAERRVQFESFHVRRIAWLTIVTQAVVTQKWGQLAEGYCQVMKRTKQRNTAATNIQKFWKRRRALANFTQILREAQMRREFATDLIIKFLRQHSSRMGDMGRPVRAWRYKVIWTQRYWQDYIRTSVSRLELLSRIWDELVYQRIRSIARKAITEEYRVRNAISDAMKRPTSIFRRSGRQFRPTKPTLNTRYNTIPSSFSGNYHLNTHNQENISTLPTRQLQQTYQQPTGQSGTSFHPVNRDIDTYDSVFGFLPRTIVRHMLNEYKATLVAQSWIPPISYPQIQVDLGMSINTNIRPPPPKINQQTNQQTNNQSNKQKNSIIAPPSIGSVNTFILATNACPKYVLSEFVRSTIVYNSSNELNESSGSKQQSPEKDTTQIHTEYEKSDTLQKDISMLNNQYQISTSVDSKMIHHSRVKSNPLPPFVPVQSAGVQSTTPHSAAPHSTAPHSATPHSAAPHSTAPHSATPHSAAPQSPVQRSRNIVRRHRRGLSSNTPDMERLLAQAKRGNFIYSNEEQENMLSHAARNVPHATNPHCKATEYMLDMRQCLFERIDGGLRLQRKKENASNIPVPMTEQDIRALDQQALNILRSHFARPIRKSTYQNENWNNKCSINTIVVRTILHESNVRDSAEYLPTSMKHQISQVPWSMRPVVPSQLIKYIILAHILFKARIFYKRTLTKWKRDLFKRRQELLATDTEDIRQMLQSDLKDTYDRIEQRHLRASTIHEPVPCMLLLQTLCACWQRSRVDEISEELEWIETTVRKHAWDPKVTKEEKSSKSDSQTSTKHRFYSADTIAAMKRRRHKRLVNSQKQTQAMRSAHFSRSSHQSEPIKKTIQRILSPFVDLACDLATEAWQDHVAHDLHTV